VHHPPWPLLAQPASPYLAHAAATVVIPAHAPHPTTLLGQSTLGQSRAPTAPSPHTCCPPHQTSNALVCHVARSHWPLWRCPRCPRVPTATPTGRLRPNHPKPCTYLRVAYCLCQSALPAIFSFDNGELAASIVSLPSGRHHRLSPAASSPREQVRKKAHIEVQLPKPTVLPLLH
jgi:hypothetical protein